MIIWMTDNTLTWRVKQDKTAKKGVWFQGSFHMLCFAVGKAWFMMSGYSGQVRGHGFITTDIITERSKGVDLEALNSYFFLNILF